MVGIRGSHLGSLDALEGEHMETQELIRASLLCLHVLAGAAWFGSVFYGVFVLYPRADTIFESIAERERFLISLSHGLRWHMIAAMSLVGLSGVGIALTPRNDMSVMWLTLVGIKAGLLILCALLFWRVSWTWWPARTFALEAELPAIHREFRIGAMVMLCLIGLSVVAGALLRFC